jgi:hypothetical protein
MRECGSAPGASAGAQSHPATDHFAALLADAGHWYQTLVEASAAAAVALDSDQRAAAVIVRAAASWQKFRHQATAGGLVCLVASFAQMVHWVEWESAAGGMIAHSLLAGLVVLAERGPAQALAGLVAARVRSGRLEVRKTRAATDCIWGTAVQAHQCAAGCGRGCGFQALQWVCGAKIVVVHQVNGEWNTAD